MAWSGGSDSTALLLALHWRGFRLEAWHVDHAWHADSAAEAEFLASIATRWQIPFRTARLALPDGRNREALARAGRFECFARWSQASGLTTLALGHQRGDAAETVAMRLLQGSGIAGCRGIAATADIGALQLRRPLLGCDKESLEQWLRSLGVEWRHDRSNSDETLLRNRIRRRLFPAMRAAGVDPCELFLRFGAQARLIQAAIESLADAVPIEVVAGGVRIDFHCWSAEAQPVRVALLQRMVARLQGEGRVLGRRHLLAIERWRAAGALGGLDLSRCRLQRHRRSLQLSPSDAVLPGLSLPVAKGEDATSGTSHAGPSLYSASEWQS